MGEWPRRGSAESADLPEKKKERHEPNPICEAGGHRRSRLHCVDGMLIVQR